MSSNADRQLASKLIADAIGIGRKPATTTHRCRIPRIVFGRQTHARSVQGVKGCRSNER